MHPIKKLEKLPPKREVVETLDILRQVSKSSSALGELIIWTIKFYNGSFSDCRNHKYSFEIGVGFILLFVLVLSYI